MFHECTYRVPYADTDQMGVVYYANYLIYFERSRTEMLREAGLPYRELEKMGCFLPVSEVRCRYFGSARYDDLLTFRSCISATGRVRLTVTTEVLRGTELLVRGEVTLGCVDDTHHITRLPEELEEKCRKYCEKELLS